MSDILEQIDYNKEPGNKPDKPITIYALSTCAFCKKAIEYVKKHNVEFRWVHLDQLGLDTKRSVKAELKNRHKNLPVFPVLVYGDKAESGFNENKWQNTLGLL